MHAGDHCMHAIVASACRGAAEMTWDVPCFASGQECRGAYKPLSTDSILISASNADSADQMLLILLICFK